MKTAFYITIAALLSAMSVACTTTTTQQDSQSTHLTTCDQPDCFVKAKQITPPFQETDDLTVRAAPFVEFNLVHPPIKLMTSPSSLIVIDEQKNTFVTFQASLESLGLEGLDNVDMYQLMKWYFLHDYKDLEQLKLPADILIGARAFRLSFELSKVEELHYFEREDLLIFSFYEPQETMYRVFIVHQQQPAIMVNIDIKSISKPNFSRFISSIHQF